ncbi:MAG: response regulator receiver protein [Bacteroidetes bacterium]|nr:response regulator receiver protein [Bacteroidota bacterium]
MNNPSILVVCKHPEILATILRLLHKKEGWKALGAGSVEQAESLCSGEPIQIVLFGAGVEENEEEQLRTNLSAIRPGIQFTKHYGGGSGLLYAEVFSLLEK